jgi:hypothetical protein
MDLEKLKQETEDLKQLDTKQLTPEQLFQLVEKISSMLEKSETFLSDLKINEINKEDETDN